ncbi:MAG: hypothetical protein KGY50_01450 [Candidatus Thermoplasmatota archaeon]|nr:hypothetical protein [Candidatus Thermoplasmatota archaeon]
MKDKILNEAMKWYETQENNPPIEDFIDLVINKTTDSVMKHVRSELEQEFSNGNLKHPFFISDEYYLELKLKDIKNKYLVLANAYQEDE